MQEKYFKTEHSIKAYADIGYPHPSTPWDNEYQEKVRRFPIVESRVIQKAIRVQVDSDENGAAPKEYLLWNELELRKNDLGNRDLVVRTNLGIYPILTPIWEWKWGEDGNKTKEHASVPTESIGYYMEWNAKTKKEIEPFILKSPDRKRNLPASQLGVKRDGDSHVILVNYKQFFEDKFESLYTSIGEIAEKQYIAKVEEHQQRATLV